MKKSYNNWARKCLLTLITVIFLSVMPSLAQELEKQSNTTGYINCSYGVAVITQELKSMKSASYSGYTFSSTYTTAKSLYALNANGEPETLLWVRIPSEYIKGGIGYSPSWEIEYFEYSILPGTKRIAKGAFVDCSNILQLNIPSSIKYIPEDCFSGLNSHALIDIIDDTQSSFNARQLSEPEKEEVGRYNLQGMKVNEDAHGVQIIQYNNGSAQKVLSK